MDEREARVARAKESVEDLLSALGCSSWMWKRVNVEYTAWTANAQRIFVGSIVAPVGMDDVEWTVEAQVGSVYVPLHRSVVK